MPRIELLDFAAVSNIRRCKKHRIVQFTIIIPNNVLRFVRDDAEDFE
jgi:hypothetical protein